MPGATLVSEDTAARPPWEWLGVVGVGVLGLVAVWVPYGGDTALFATAARTLNAGGLYYRDFWDVKQPGIYWFSQAAGALPGPLWLPERLLLALAMGVLAWLALYWARGVLTSTWAIGLAPLLVAGPLLLTMKPDLLGVPETLIGLPLFASLLLLRRGFLGQPRSRWALLSGGALGGVALLLKLPYVIVLAAFMLAIVWEVRRDRADEPMAVRVRALAWYAAGVLAPLALVVGLYAWKGSLGLLLTTTFDYPRAITGLGTLHQAHLYKTLLATSVAMLLPLAGLAVAGMLATGEHQRRWVRLCVVWGLATLPVVAIQRPSGYQAEAFVVPLGLLGALGVDALLGRQVRGIPHRVAASLALIGVALAVPLLVVPTLGVAVRAVQAGLVPSESALLGVAPAISPDFRRSQELAGTAPVPIPESLYLFGDPQVYVLLDRAQAIEVNGWSPEFAVPTQWAETRRELERTKPALVLVDAFSRPFLEAQSPEILAMLAAEYTAHPEPATGDTWFLRRPGVPAGPLPITAEGAQISRP